MHEEEEERLSIIWESNPESLTWTVSTLTADSARMLLKSSILFNSFSIFYAVWLLYC